MKPGKETTCKQTSGTAASDKPGSIEAEVNASGAHAEPQTSNHMCRKRSGPFTPNDVQYHDSDGGKGSKKG